MILFCNLIVTVTIGAAVIVHRFTLDRITGVQSVASGPLRTRADCDMMSGRTRGARTALAASTWVAAREVDTRAIVGTIAVSEAFPMLTACQGVADVAGRTRAHRPLPSGVIMTWRTNRIRTTGIRFAKIT